MNITTGFRRGAPDDLPWWTFCITFKSGRQIGIGHYWTTRKPAPWYWNPKKWTKS